MGNGEQLGYLKGEHVVLEPLSLSHITALSVAVADGQLWQLWFANVPKP
ncbi:MAG: GNAT family N-acetyltransferase, partial [Shewanella sp.]